MQIFELHFNPKLKTEQIFDSFVYEPENNYEKKLGSLYIVGEVENILDSNSKFLDNLAQNIKKNYYGLSVKSQEKALLHSLKKSNEFLAQEVKKENVSWLGNLNFSIISLNNFDLNFTKTGNIKILLIRQDQIIDISKSLDIEEIDPYPLKIFFNTVSGKLIENDKILILTKPIFEFFKEKNILSKIAKAQNTINSKKLKEIIPTTLFTKGEGSKISGICFLALLKTGSEKKEQGESILFQAKKKLIPFKIPKIRLPKVSLPKINFLKMKPQNIKFPKLKIPIRTPGPIIEKFKNQKKFTKKILLIIVLAFILTSGFYIFKGRSENKEEEIRISLEQIQQKIDQAENLLIFKNETKANSLLKQAWEEISLLSNEETSLKQDILLLKKSIEESLNQLNKLEIIENPEITRELNPDQSEIEHKKILYSFSKTNLIFYPPQTVFILKSNNWQEKEIDPPSFEFNLDSFSSYLSNLYFLDKTTCQIAKYSYSGNSNWRSAKIWLKDPKECSNPKSIAIDGSVWILNGNESILQYYAESFKEKIDLDFFPYPENITKIITRPNIPYLYLLEPKNKRVIIIDKTGQIIKQFQSDKFNNLKDITVSPDGETIYLLNSSTIYKLKLEI